MIMHQARSLIIYIVILLAIFFLTSCNRGEDKNMWVGQLESERIELTAESFEPITQVFVVEGQSVTQGELLLQQSSEKFAAQFNKADALIAQTTARLAELNAGPKPQTIQAAEARAQRAEYQLEFAQLEFVRAQELRQKQLGSQEQTDITQANVNSARSQVAEARATLAEVSSGYTTEQIAQAEQAVAIAKADRERLQVELNRLNHFAPADAVVDQVLFSVGERPLTGQPVITLLTGEHPYARVYIPEAIRASVTTGMAVSVQVDGIQEAIAGTVRWVSSEATFTPYFALTEQDRSRLSYLAKVDLAEMNQRLPDGLPVQVYPALGN